MNAKQWESKVGKNENIKFTITSDTKDILGYACEKATTVTYDSSIIVVYFTKEIMPEAMGMELQFSQLSGIVLEYVSIKKNLQITYLAKSVNFEPVPVQKFELPKSGFRILGYEESAIK
jgi:GLPGLI family protein